MLSVLAVGDLVPPLRSLLTVTDPVKVSISSSKSHLFQSLSSV